MSSLAVLSVVSEVFPLIKTGGLADVAGALPGALAREGVEMRTLIPGYPAVMAALDKPKVVLKLADLFGGPAKLLASKAAGLDLFVLDAPHLYDRPGNPYHDADGVDWPDNPFRFAALAKVAAEIGLGGVTGFKPAVVHTHDWQTGLTAAYLDYDGRKRPAPSRPSTISPSRANIRRNCSPNCAFPRMPGGWTGSNITAPSASSKRLCGCPTG